MSVYQIVGPLTSLAVDTPTTLTLSTATNNFAGNKNITVLKIDNPDLTTTAALGFSLTAAVSTYDAANAIGIAPGATVIVQVANANFTGPVYVRATGGTGLYVQAVAVSG
jgi:hypothetical protein